MRKDLKGTIGSVLRAKREKLGISQEELGERAGVGATVRHEINAA
jgi:transcriptional regulator with XRE-family HTH domain